VLGSVRFADVELIGFKERLIALIVLSFEQDVLILGVFIHDVDGLAFLLTKCLALFLGDFGRLFHNTYFSMAGGRKTSAIIIWRRCIFCLAFINTPWHGEAMDHKPPITIINVAGLPQPLARLLRALVHTLQRLLPTTPKTRGKVALLTKPGTVKGPLTRQHIYEDVG